MSFIERLWRSLKCECAHLHCLEGRLEVMLGQSIYELQRDQLIHLPPGLPHAVRALDDSSAIATIVLCSSE